MGPRMRPVRLSFTADPCNPCRPLTPVLRSSVPHHHVCRGADRVWVYAFDSKHGALRGALNSALHLKLPAGSGPRHLDFHPNGKWVFVLCELDGMVVTCEWDSEHGQLLAKHSVYALPEGMASSRAHHSGCAHVAVHPSGRHAYATTRTDNQLVVFTIHPKSGALAVAGRVSTCGICPRNFLVDADRVRVLNQDSQTLIDFALDPKTGALADAAHGATLHMPGVCGHVLCRAP